MLKEKESFRLLYQAIREIADKIGDNQLETNSVSLLLLDFDFEHEVFDELYLIYPGQKLKVTGNASTNSGSATTTNRGYNTPVFSHQNLYTWGQCTYHVFNRRAEIGKGISTYWWNANNWDNAAAADGYTIDNRPTVGSIAQTDVGYYGHVMFVERVNNDGSILVSEMNYSAAPGILTYRTVPAYQVNNYRYIH